MSKSAHIGEEKTPDKLKEDWSLIRVLESALGSTLFRFNNFKMLSDHVVYFLNIC